MNLKEEIEAMVQLIEIDDKGDISEGKLNVNTVMDAIIQKQEELLSMEEIYRTYSNEALKNLQEEVMKLAKKAVSEIKEMKEKEDIELPSMEYVSRSAILEAVSRVEDKINYHNERLEKVLNKQAEDLGTYLEKRNVSSKEIEKMKAYYRTHGVIDEHLRKNILDNINNFLRSKNENESNIEMVNDVVEKDLDSFCLSFNKYDLLPRTARYASQAAFLSKFSSVSYLDLNKYLKEKNGFTLFLKEYKIDPKLGERLSLEKTKEEAIEELWQILVDQGMVNTDQPYHEEVRACFEQDVNKLIDNQRKNEKGKEPKQNQEKEKELNHHQEKTVTTHFRTLCTNMSFTDQQTNELLEIMKNKKQPLQFKDGKGIYRVLKEQIISAQQKKIPMNGNREETIRACQQLIKERQEFFKYMYQYPSMLKQEQQQKLPISEGKKIIKQRKNTDQKVAKNIFAAMVAREKDALRKFRKRYSKRGNYSLTVGSMVRVPMDHGEEMQARVHAIKVFDETNGKPYYSVSPGETIEQLIQMHKLNEKTKLSFGCEIYTENGYHRWIEYDPFHSFAYDENAFIEGSNKVK